MEIGKTYRQTFFDGTSIFFYVSHMAKNGSAMGVKVEGRRAVKASMPPSFWRLWTVVPDNDPLLPGIQATIKKKMGT